MNELLQVAMGVGAISAAAILVKMAFAERHVAGLSRLEAKIDALLKHQGVRFDPFADVPPSVIDALRRGNKIEAVKAYRAATAAGLREAKDYVEELQRRAAPRV